MSTMKNGDGFVCGNGDFAPIDEVGDGPRLLPQHTHRPVYEAGNTYCADCLIWLHAGRHVQEVTTYGNGTNSAEERGK